MQRHHKQPGRARGKSWLKICHECSVALWWQVKDQGKQIAVLEGSLAQVEQSASEERRRMQQQISALQQARTLMLAQAQCPSLPRSCSAVTDLMRRDFAFAFDPIISPETMLHTKHQALLEKRDSSKLSYSAHDCQGCPP